MNNAETPLVSIIITSYNRVTLIGKAIQSCLDQDYPNLEIIISDNASTDNSDAVIKKYIHDNRIKYIVNEKNIGMIANFKSATEKARGKFLTYVSSDDYLCNAEYISTAVSLINKYPDVVLVAAKNCTLEDATDVLTEDATDHVFAEEFRDGKEVFKLFHTCFLPGWGGVLMDREKLMKTNVFESKAQSLDYEANLKLLLEGNISFIKKPSYVFRRHSAQASGAMNYEKHFCNLDFIENTYGYGMMAETGINLASWRKTLYKAYLSGQAELILTRKNDFNKLLAYVKRGKKIRLNLFTAPKLTLHCLIYNNFHTLGVFLKHFHPRKYKSIRKIITDGQISKTES